MVPQIIKQNVEKAKVKGIEMVKNEHASLKSLRVRLVYLTFILWAFAIYKMPVENLKDIFVQITFILSILVLVYVLGKKNIKLDLGPLKLDMTEVEKKEEGKVDDGQHNNPGDSQQ